MLGAGGAIAQHIIRFLKNDGKLNLTLFARDRGQFTILYLAKSLNKEFKRDRLLRNKKSPSFEFV